VTDNDRFLPGVNSEPIIFGQDTSEGQYDVDTSDPAEEGAGGGEETGRPVVPSDDSNTQPGRPILSTQVENLPLLKQAGEARVNALTSLYGEDAMILGPLLFKIPPLSIKIDKGNIIHRWKAIRTKDYAVAPSGHGEAKIYIPLAFVGEREILDSLSTVVALYKTSPFCFIENLHIRKMMLPEGDEDSMGVCLEVLQMDVQAGMPDTVYATLSLGWFNYKIYSQHFYFRENWVSADRRQQQQEQNNTESTESLTNFPNYHNTIVDLSGLEAPEELDVSYPPEARLPDIDVPNDSSDSRIAPSSPVVYPFNSMAYSKLLQQYDLAEGRVGSFSDGWHDIVTMSWNSYAHVPWPRNIMTVEEGEVLESAAPPPPPAPAPRDRSSDAPPPPVSDNRDIILFGGDSITRGYLALSGNGDVDDRVAVTSSRFPRRSGFSYYAHAQVGMNSSGIKRGLFRTMNDSAFAGRIAAVVIGAGTNPDGSTTTTLNNVRACVNKAVQIGAIAIVLPLWPIGDDGNLRNGQQCTPTSDTLQASVQTLSVAYRGLASSSSVVFINTHVSSISTDPNSFNGAWVSSFRQLQCNGTIINIHPNAVGYRTIAQHIYNNMPWSSIEGLSSSGSSSEAAE
jgi:hypothetical protein